jgi:hypothetical protein
MRCQQDFTLNRSNRLDVVSNDNVKKNVNPIRAVSGFAPLLWPQLCIDINYQDCMTVAYRQNECFETPVPKNSVSSIIVPNETNCTIYDDYRCAGTGVWYELKGESVP